VDFFLHLFKPLKKCAPGVPRHAFLGATVRVVSKRLAAHGAANVAMVSKLEIDVD